MHRAFLAAAGAAALWPAPALALASPTSSEPPALVDAALTVSAGVYAGSEAAGPLNPSPRWRPMPP